MRILRFVHSTCLKYCACHEKVMPGHTKRCTCHAKSSYQNWRSDDPKKCNPSQEISAWSPNTSTSCVLLYCACHASFQILFKCSTQGAQSPAKRHLNVQKCSGPYPSVFLHFWLRNVLRATTACIFSTSQLPKVLWTWCALYILTWKYASRHNGLHFFNISTSKNALNLSVFNTFDFEMCFAPQLFPHLNFKKWSEHGLFCTFWPHQPL